MKLRLRQHSGYRSLLLLLLLGRTAVSAQTAELSGFSLAGPLSSEMVPPVGTFWFVQSRRLPPLPYNPYPDLPVYSLGTNNHYLVDDSSVDYAALWEQRQVNEAVAGLELSLGMQAHTLSVPLPPGEGDPGTNDPPEAVPAFQLGGNLGFAMPLLSSNGFAFELSNTVLGTFYDVFYTTNLNEDVAPPELSLTNWAWWTRGSTNQTLFTFTNLDFSQVYFRLGTTNDSDADGLTDAFEELVNHTDPQSGDSDGDGMNDGNEWWFGLNPRSADSDGDGYIDQTFSVRLMNPGTTSAVP